jgi:transcriptional regulator with XRE-family HTH domain
VTGAIGRVIESARIRQGLSQEALAGQLGRAQQTVSRWESGQSRPRGRDIAALAEALGLDEHLLREDSPGTRREGSKGSAVSHPVRPLVPALPFGSLTPEDFEEFVAVLISETYPTAKVRRLGGRGDNQEGFDILATLPDDRELGIQCKREIQFGPAKVAKAIADAQRPVDQCLIALGRAATKQARDRVEEHSGWALWDQLDLSRQVRALPGHRALRIVRTFFPNYAKDFLGYPVAGPWASAQDYFSESPNRVLNHRQPLVGRENEIKEISSWVVDTDGPNIGVVFGRGGVGKSKILWEIATRSYTSEVHFAFLSMDQVPRPDDFEMLPHTGKVILIVDDDSRIEHLAGIVSLLWQHRRDAKMLVASRPDNEAILHDQFWRLGQIPARVTRWTLRDLSFGEACDLVAPLINRGVIDPWTQQLARISADCPLIAVVAADLIRADQLGRGAFVSNEVLRREVFRLFGERGMRAGSRSDVPARRAVLAAVAAFQPVRLSDEHFSKAIASLTRISSWDDVNRRIRELEDSGLILRRGDSVRIVPDMLGDVVLADAAFDDRAGRITSFLSDAHVGATATPLQHLLINASRMEWQLRQRSPLPVEMTAPLWSKLIQDTLDSSPDTQLQMLSLVAKAAYYQPKPAYDLVRAVLSNNPDAAVEEAGPWRTARQGVLDSATRVLRNVAYNFQFLRPVLETLWQLAQDDERPAKSYSDHPVGVLKSLAEIRTGKPIAYIETIIDAAGDWLSSDYRVSPFDVLEPALELEVTEHISREPNVINFYAYPIDPDSVRGIRQRIVNLATKEALSANVTAAVRAVHTLERAIRLPSGKFGREVDLHERATWAQEFVPIIEQLGKLGREYDTDPCVRIAIRQALSTHVQESLPSTEKAQEQLSSVIWTADDDLAICIHDHSHRLDTFDDANFEDRFAALERENERVAAGLLSQHTSDELLAHIEHRLLIEDQAFKKSNNDGAARFLLALFTLSRPTAKALCAAALEGDYPQLSRHVGQAIRVLADSADVDAIPFASAMLESESLSLQRGAADALTWNRGTRTDLLDGEREALLKLSRHKNEGIRAAIGRAAWIIGSANRSAAYDLLSQADIGRSPKLVGEILWGFASGGPLQWHETTRRFRENLLERLVDFDSIGDYHLLDAVSTMSEHDPLGVTRLLLHRTDRLKGNVSRNYHPLPYRWDPPLRICRTPQFAECLAEVRIWIQHADEDCAPAYIQDRGAEVFALVVGEWTPQAITSLGPIETATSISSLISIARLLARAPVEVLFANVELIAALLQRAASFGKGETDRLFGALLPVNIDSKVSSLADAAAARIQTRDRAREIAAALPQGSIEHRFFMILADCIQSLTDSRLETLDYDFDRKDW